MKEPAKKLQLRSNLGCFCSMPLPGEEVEQQLIRESIGIPSRFVFGGGTPSDQIERVYLEFDDETVMIDRKGGSLEYAKRKNSQKFFYHLYQDSNEVSKLLDALGLSNVPKDSAENSCKLTIDYYAENQRMIKGHLEGENWFSFLEKIKDFIVSQEGNQVLFK